MTTREHDEKMEKQSVLRRKYLNADAVLAMLRERFATIPDHRTGDVTISLPDALMSGFAPIQFLRGGVSLSLEFLFDLSDFLRRVENHASGSQKQGGKRHRHKPATSHRSVHFCAIQPVI